MPLHFHLLVRCKDKYFHIVEIFTPIRFDIQDILRTFVETNLNMALQEIFTDEQLIEYNDMIERVKQEAVTLSTEKKECVVMTSESPYSVHDDNGEDVEFFKLITEVFTIKTKPVGFAQAKFIPMSETYEVQITMDEYLDLINEYNKDETE